MRIGKKGKRKKYHKTCFNHLNRYIIVEFLLFRVSTLSFGGNRLFLAKRQNVAALVEKFVKWRKIYPTYSCSTVRN